MRFTDSVVALSPAVVTAAFVILFVGAGMAMRVDPFGGAEWATTYSVVMLLMLVPLMLWHYSLYRAASDRGFDIVGNAGQRAIFFLLTVGGMLVHLAIFPIWMRTPPSSSLYAKLLQADATATIVACISYFVAIWSAANALVRFEERERSPAVHKTLGTWFLELYLPIGIWFIYPRIRRLLEAPIPVRPQ